MSYTSQLTGQEIDNALMLARGIGQRHGVPVSSGNGTIQARRLDSILSDASTGIPESSAVWAAIKDRTSNYLHFSGTVSTPSDLPEEPAIGDAYHITSTGKNVAWNGDEWSDVGEIATFDITPEDIGAARQTDLDDLSNSVNSLDESLNTRINALDAESVKSVNGITPDQGNVQLTPESLLDLVYPVGSIYMSLNSTSPASLFGGTWAQIKDVFLLGAGDTYSVSEDTKDGGSATVTLQTANLPSHNHSANASGYSFMRADSLATASVSTGSTSAKYVYTNDSHHISLTGTTSNTGSGQEHENMPPYKTVYMWQRME